MDIGTPGSQRRRFYPHQPRRGRAERVSVSLCWCTCSGRVVITNCELLLFCYPPTAALQRPTSWFLRSSFAAYHSASKLVSLAQALPLFIHILHAEKRVAVCVHARHSERTLLSKMEWKRKCRGGELNIKLTIFGIADNASRRCKWDKWPLSWRLDVARWWFAFNHDSICGMAVAKQKVLLREWGTWDREEESEMNSYYIPQCIAAPWPVLNWSGCVGLPQRRTGNRQTHR